MTRECRQANAEDFPAVRRMLELYQYELSDMWDQDLDPQGEYGYELEQHQKAERFFAHVMLVDQHYAGFALVAPASVTQREGCWMEQFFVLKKYRRSGHGEALAVHVVRSHPGAWEIGQMPANAPARAFWLRVVSRLTAGRFSEVRVTEGWWHGTVQRFRLEAPVER